MNVRVIGAGVSSAAFCARLLELVPTASIVVSEMGRGVGGRCSKREWSQPITHGCPAFDVQSDAFQHVVDTWVQDKVAHVWDPLHLGVLDTDAQTYEPVPSGKHRLYQLDAKALFEALPKSSVEFQPNTLIDRLTFADTTSTWLCNDETTDHDWLVATSPLIAHRTRWGARFPDNSPEPPLSLALNAMGEDHTPLLEALNDVRSTSITTLLTEFRGEAATHFAAHVPFDMVHIQNDAVLGKMVCQKNDRGFVVVSHSTPDYSAKVKRLKLRGEGEREWWRWPSKDAKHRKQHAADMQSALVECFAVLPGFDGDTLQSWVDSVNDRKGKGMSEMHTWGAAFPTCRGDYFEEELSRVVEQSKLVLCGDYFGKAPARVETAVLSGRDAAEKLAKQMERGS